MAISLPSSPTVGQTYTLGGKIWTWNGTAWKLPSTTGVLPVLYGGTGVTTSTGTGNNVLSDSPTLTGNTTYSTNSRSVYGPNSSWSSYLYVGGDGVNGITRTNNIASVVTTNGNVHIDAGTNSATYVNYYSGTAGTNFGNGAGGTVASINSAGFLSCNGLSASSNTTLVAYTETIVALGTVVAAATLVITAGTFITATLTTATACTFTMPTVAAGKSFILYLRQPAAGTATTATFTNVKWGIAGAPTITATVGKMDILSFSSDGTAWYGSAAQGYTY